MKNETLKNKVNELILTGHTSFKGRKAGLTSKWISDATFEKLSDFLFTYKCATSTELKRTSENTATIVVYRGDELIIIGNLNFY